MTAKLRHPGREACTVCKRKDVIVSEVLGVCASCVRDKPDEALPYIQEAHKLSRMRYGLPTQPPKTPSGIPCNLCSNECMLGKGERGFCGLRKNEAGRLESLAKPDRGVLYAYRDPHVTNCCAAWFCPAGTGSGYPRYARTPGPEGGYANYAVFFYGCNFNCLFCQNSSHKEVESRWTVGMDDFVHHVSAEKRYTCICYFGGSPEPQLPFAINVSRRILEEDPNRVIRVCFEWNGCGNPKLVRRAAELAFESGGNIKFDLKAFTPALSLALSGVPNFRAYENFEMVAEEFYGGRSSVPVLNATTLLVPGYVDSQEVELIAEFISRFDVNIPYSLLVFHPDFMMRDLPVTPTSQATSCYEAAKKHLRRVHLGNLHLLGLHGLVFPGA